MCWPGLCLIALLALAGLLLALSTDAQAWAISTPYARVRATDVSGFYAVRCAGGVGFITDADSVRAQFRWLVNPRGRCPLLANRGQEYRTARQMLPQRASR